MGDVIVLLAPGAFGLGVEPDDDGWHEPHWQDFALCAETDPEAFFPQDGVNAWDAKKVCRACEVRAECLVYALDHPTLTAFGVWGGLSERERRRFKREAA